MGFRARNDAQMLTITVEIQAEGTHEEDVTLVPIIGQDVVYELQGHGYTVTSATTGRRGGDFLVQVVMDVTRLATNAWVHKEEILSDTSSLIAICSGVVPALRFFVHAYQRRTGQGRNTSLSQPMKLTLEIDGAPVTVEASSIEQAEAALELVQRFKKQHPRVAKNVNQKSKAKIKAHVPAQTNRKHR
jgi:hypothetical protein